MPTPVIPISGSDAPVPVRHDFTDPQLTFVKVYLVRLSEAERVLNEAKQSIGLFMDYLQKENRMAGDTMWSLAFDPDGLPFMSGAPIQ